MCAPTRGRGEAAQDRDKASGIADALDAPRGNRAGESRPADLAPSWTSRVWYRFWQRMLQISWVLLYRVRRTGMENIPAEGPIILAPNHQSHLDPPLVGSCCPRRMSYMARASLFHFAPFAWLIRSFGAFPIDREAGRGIAGVKETLRRLKAGHVIMMFPEGTRTPDGSIHPLRSGVRTLAVRSGAVIVPVAIEGAYQAWPRWRKFPRLGTIHIHFGEPLWPEQIRELGEDALVEEVERRVRRYHAELCRHPAIAHMRRAGRHQG